MSSPTYHPGPEQPTPEQRLLLMNDEEWEIFIEQCARQLRVEGKYIEVKRLGGAGDKGRDVCGYAALPPAEATWDLYQGKHYGSTLSPSAFGPELAKFLWCVYSGQYPRPENYYICALKVGPALHDYTINPEKLKSWIIDEWDSKKGNFGTFNQKLTKSLSAFLKGFPFDIIKVKTTADLLEIHSRSPEHWELFGVLPPRIANPEMPEDPEKDEQRYIQALLDVYQEAIQSPPPDPLGVPPRFKKHFQSQRKLFFCAEGLYRFSRDKLPGAFDDLLNQVEVGIGGDLSYPHPDGLARLTKVLDKASGLQVSDNPLHARLRAGDLGGACHHLANRGRAAWVEEDE